MATIEVVEVSHDDRRWYSSTDLDGLEEFLADPRGWLAAKNVILADSYIIQIKSNVAENKGKGEIDIVGSASLVGNDLITKAILISFHRQSVLQALWREALADGQPKNAVLPSRWLDVASGMQNKVTLDLTFRPQISASGTLDHNAGQVYPHFELAFDRALIAKYVVAIISEPEGFDEFYGSIPVQSRKVWYATGVMQPFTRNGTTEIFAPLSQSIDVLIEGDDAPCDEGYMLMACSSDSGTYAGNPYQADSVIAMEDIMIKPYCVKQTPVGPETFEARSVRVNNLRAERLAATPA